MTVILKDSKAKDISDLLEITKQWVTEASVNEDINLKDKLQAKIMLKKIKSSQKLLNP